MSLHFAQPIWLLVGTVLCLLFIVSTRMAAGWKQKRLARFAAPKMIHQLTANVSIPRRRLKLILVFFALVGCFVALAGPQHGEQWLEVTQKGIDILIGLDTSRSMLAPDIAPNRLQRAKLAIKDFVARLDGDRIGLMPFAGASFLMCPLTTDYTAFTASLDAVTPASIPVGGTNIAEVITRAAKILAGETNHKILILVTDGENLQGQAMAAAKQAAEQKMTIYTVGVGTKAGELIPDSVNDGGFIKDNNGNFIRSRLDEKTLQQIARITGGMYVPLGSMGQGFTTIYREKLKLVPKEEHQERKQRRPIERFYWPLAFSIFLLMVEFLVSGRKSNRFPGVPFMQTAGRRLFNHRKLLIVCILLALSPAPANGSTAEELFHQGKLDQAEKEYIKALDKQPADPALNFNLGDVQYRKKQFAKASASFSKALATDDLDLQAKAYFNLGNAQYQLGRSTPAVDPEQTIAHYTKAVKSYTDCLRLQPEDSDAKANLAMVKKQLEQLKKQQKKQNKQQKEKQDQKNNKEQKRNSANTSKNGKGRNQARGDNKNTGKSAGPGRNNKQQSRKNKQEQKNSTEKKTQSNQAQGQQKNGEAKNEEAAGKPKNGSNKPGEGATIQPGTPQQAEQGKQMSKEDIRRRKLGKMTRAEATNLLDALKEEEGRLEYIPGQTRSSEQPVSRDW